MKKLFLSLFVLSAMVSARSELTYSNLLLYTSVNNTTNNGSSVIIGTARVSMPTYSLQHGALTDTNNALYYTQISVDGVNFTTIATNKPSSTNAGAIDSFQPSVQRMSVYTRVQFVTTNNVSLGGQVTLGSGL
jgi:uncharacterized membrane protein (UPF0182 family)